MRRFIITSGLLTLVGALVACQAKHTALSAVTPGSTQLAVIAPVNPLPGPTGAVSLTVRWPERAVQYIPGTANKVVFGVYPLGSATPLATGSVSRTNESTSSFTFKPLPVSTLLFTAEARDPDGYVGASGSTTVAIQPNKLTPGSITMVTTARPTLTAFSPTNGCPGQQVNITGTGFLFSRNASYSIRYGGVTLPESSTFRFSDSTMGCFIPANGTNGAFAISVGGVTVATDSIFQVISSVSVSPPTFTLDSGTPLVQLMPTAKDAANSTVTNPSLPWIKLSQDCPSCGTVDSLVSIDATGKVTRGTSGKTGTVTIGVGIAPVLATATITVN